VPSRPAKIRWSVIARAGAHRGAPLRMHPQTGRRGGVSPPGVVSGKIVFCASDDGTGNPSPTDGNATCP